MKGRGDILGKDSIRSVEIIEKTPVGFFEYDSVAEKVAILLAKKGHEVSFFRASEEFEISPDSQVISIVTSSQEVYQHIITTGHNAICVELDCCIQHAATRISEECLEEGASITTRL